MTQPICLVDECDAPAKVRGLCRRHYQRWYDAPKNKTYTPLEIAARPERTCSIEGCGRPFLAKGMCSRHWAHNDRYGTPHRRKYPCPNCGESEPIGGYKHDLGKYCSAECHREHRAELREARIERDLKLARTFLDGPDRKCRGCKGLKPALAFVSKHGKPTKTCEECRAKAATYATPERRREDALRRMYGIGVADYDRMLAEQDGLCRICAQPESTKRNGQVARLHVDHCHESGVIRGLLCGRCNSAIGLLMEDPVRVRAALDYLTKVPTT